MSKNGEELVQPAACHVKEGMFASESPGIALVGAEKEGGARRERAEEMRIEGKKRGTKEGCSQGH